MAPDYDSQISALEQSLEYLKPRMRDARERWLDEVAPYLARSWDSSARATVTSQTERTKAIGREALASMKAEVNGLLPRAPELANLRLVEESPGTWPDLAPQTDPHDASFGGGTAGSSAFRIYRDTAEESKPHGIRAPSVLGEGMRDLLATVAPILANQGYDPPGAQPVTGTARSWRWSAHHMPSWSAAMADRINEYADLHEEYLATLAKLDRLWREKDESEAGNLWDEL